MNLKLLSNNWSGYFFNTESFKNKEATRAEWDAVMADYNVRKEEAKERENQRATIKRAFREWYVANRVTISPRKIKSINDEVDKSYPLYYVSTPSLWAWYEVDKTIVKIDPCNGYGTNFDRVYDMVEAWLNKQNRVSDEKERHFKASVEYCIANSLEWNSQNVVQVATLHRVEALELEAIRERREIDFDQCDECSTWVAGERRCSCGNRRVSFEYSGEYPDCYIYPEAY